MRESYLSSSSYGWADYDDYFLGGTRQHRRTGWLFSHTKPNDIISITFDCNNRKIYYKNERNEKLQELSVDINKCPFPWKLHIHIYGRDDRVRLLDVISDSATST
ncbi:unnamed protein product [Rotaria sp. Silwood1]|nr:unnamed protein product [Rotaria sp. Silwood1]CAF3883552.1 unnamed protein product [Rotaria sp. Silwood1]